MNKTHATTLSRAEKTRRNLDAAFAGESMAYQKYLYFARLARAKGDEEAARLFEDTAKQETGHAFAHLTLIYPADQLTVDEVLRLAIEGERYEHTVMYPGYEEDARREGEHSAVEEFQDQARESREHELLFASMLHKARRRFAALAKVEKLHAERYQRALDQRRRKS
jgi:rubrerythrin